MPALESLERAARDRCFDLLAIRYDPRFDPVRDERRFNDVVRTIGIA